MTKPTKWHMHPVKTDQPGHPPCLIGVFAVRMGPELQCLKLGGTFRKAQLKLMPSALRQALTAASGRNKH